MEEPISVTLDFTKCKYISEVYQEMRTKMQWQDWYGECIYAIWDILRGLPHYGDHFTILRPMHYTDIPYGQNEQFTRYVDKVCQAFLDAEQCCEEIQVKIEYVS